MGGVKLTEVVFPDGILPTLIETIQAIICHIVHQLILEENDSERTRELCARTYIVITLLQLDAYFVFHDALPIHIVSHVNRLVVFVCPTFFSKTCS